MQPITFTTKGVVTDVGYHPILYTTTKHVELEMTHLHSQHRQPITFTTKGVVTDVRYHHILYTTTKQEEQEMTHLHSQHATYGIQCRNIFRTFQESV